MAETFPKNQMNQNESSGGGNGGGGLFALLQMGGGDTITTISSTTTDEEMANSGGSSSSQPSPRVTGQQQQQQQQHQQQEQQQEQHAPEATSPPATSTSSEVAVLVVEEDGSYNQSSPPTTSKEERTDKATGPSRCYGISKSKGGGDSNTTMNTTITTTTTMTSSSSSCPDSSSPPNNGEVVIRPLKAQPQTTVSGGVMNHTTGVETTLTIDETKAVYWLKYCVLFVLAMAAIMIAMAYYFHSKRYEVTKFQERFDSDATKVLDSLGFTLDLTLSAVDSFVVNMISFTKYTNATWPFVTIPNYAVRTAKIRTLSKAFIIGQFQLVSHEQRNEWELYASQNDYWVQDGFDVQRNDPTYPGKKPTTYNSTYKLVSPNGSIIPDNDTSPYYLPSWQQGPIVPAKAPYNWNAAMFAPMAKVLPELLEMKHVVISEVLTMKDWAKNYVGENEDPNQPNINIYYPIIDTAADAVCSSSYWNESQSYHEHVHNQPSTGPQSGNVVGIVRIGMYWRDLIRDILPQPSHDEAGVVAVFENTCNQTFTYEIVGNHVHYLGDGDHHDTKYDDMEQMASVVDLGRSGRAAVTSSSSDDGSSFRPRTYTGVPLSQTGGCPYTVRVYPNAFLEDEYLSNEPIRITIVIILTFAFTSFVFLIYDWCVERRQKKVMNTAVESTANVSLLEEKVKERTKSLEETNRRLEEANQRVLQASQQQLLHFSCCSHEIRTPLNCIIGMSSLLQDTDLNPMQKECMQMIVSSGDLLLTVVNDVLDYSRLESGNVETVIRPSSLQELLNSVVHSIEARGLSKDLSIRTFYDPALPEFVTTDSRRLQQILFNILGNAVKFSKDGGVVELGVSLCTQTNEEEKKKEDAPEGHKGITLRFTVKDYGSGIKEEDYEKIFKPFLQANAYTERQHGGTGLGLAITSKLVNRLGGTISVESKRWNWSKFTIDFPFNESHVDVMGMSERFQHTSIFLVSNSDEEEAISRFGSYKVDLARFRTLKELQGRIETMDQSGVLSSERCYICLIHEDEYDSKLFETLSSKLPKSVLFSFGPKYSVKDTRGHVRSLEQVLPSVLMERLGACVDSIGHDSSQDAEDSETDSSTKAVPYTQFRILIAEDNIVNQKVLSRILTRLGIENVEIVGNGKLAVEREASEQFDIVLMDMDMPIMNGIEACKEITKRQGGHPKAKVVFVTAHVADEFKSECLEAGGVEFLPKPFSMDGIENCFRRVHDMCY